MQVCYPLNECKASMFAQPGTCTAQSQKYPFTMTNQACPSGQSRDYMGICFPADQCKPSLFAKPGTCIQGRTTGPGKYTVTYATRGGCSSDQIKDWMGICFPPKEAKACPTCDPGSAADPNGPMNGGAPDISWAARECRNIEC